MVCRSNSIIPVTNPCSRRSWHTFQEEKTPLPRTLDFESISDHDPLARTINEIHKCVLPKQETYRLLKPPRRKARDDPGDEEEPKDPRRNTTRRLPSSAELTRHYGYSSELTLHEQKLFLDALSLRITHNPELLKRNARKVTDWDSNKTVSPAVLARHKLEAASFNKCAEIFFYRNVQEFNDLVNPNMKEFLVNRWNSADREFTKYQVITMLMRDQSVGGEFQVEPESTENEEFDAEVYSISDQTFPSLNCFSPSDLKFYCLLKDAQRDEIGLEPSCDAVLSIDLLSKLITDTEQFSAKFSKGDDSKIIFERALPPKPASIETALNEVVRISLLMSHEWKIIDQLVKPAQTTAYDVKSLEEFMKKSYSNVKKTAGVNEFNHLCKISDKSQSFRLLVKHADAFYFKNEHSERVPVNISIKLEYQVKFGAEQMTRSELLKEWCQHKFNRESITLRYRIDAKSLTVLSITRITMEEIADELLKNHKTDPEVLIGSLMMLFGCLQRIPPANYRLQGKVGESFKKLLIFIDTKTDNCEPVEPWEVEAVSSRKWIPIDEKTPTFIHSNHAFTPCCFPTDSRKRKTTSSPKKATIKKKPQTATRQQVSPVSKPAVRRNMPARSKTFVKPKTPPVKVQNKNGKKKAKKNAKKKLKKELKKQNKK